MKLNQEELKKAITEKNKTNRSQCPPAEDLARLNAGSLSDQERSTLAEHLASCSDCAEEFRLASAGAELASGRKQVNAPSSSFKPQWFLGAAAVLALAAIAGFLFFQQTTVVTERNERGVVIQNEVVPSPQNGASLKTAPVQFSWSAVPNASSYTLILYDYQSVPIAKIDAGTSNRIDLSESDRGNLKAGYTYYWRVQYKTSEGSGESKMFRFSIE